MMRYYDPSSGSVRHPAVPKRLPLTVCVLRTFTRTCSTSLGSFARGRQCETDSRCAGLAGRARHPAAAAVLAASADRPRVPGAVPLSNLHLQQHRLRSALALCPGSVSIVVRAALPSRSDSGLFTLRSRVLPKHCCRLSRSNTGAGVRRCTRGQRTQFHHKPPPRVSSVPHFEPSPVFRHCKPGPPLMMHGRCRSSAHPPRHQFRCEQVRHQRRRDRRTGFRRPEAAHCPGTRHSERPKGTGLQCPDVWAVV